MNTCILLIMNFINLIQNAQVRQICYIAMRRDLEFINTVEEGTEETHSQVLLFVCLYSCTNLWISIELLV